MIFYYFINILLMIINILLLINISSSLKQDKAAQCYSNYVLRRILSVERFL